MTAPAVPFPSDESVPIEEAPRVTALPVPSIESAVLPALMLLAPPVAVMVYVPPLPAATVKPLPVLLARLAERDRWLKVKLPPVLVPETASMVPLKELLTSDR